MKTFKQFYTEALESKLIVIFPGRFQPFHTGHKNYYDNAKKMFPQASFYIATSDINPKNVAKEPERYPFTFAEKKEIITATGVPANEVAQTVQPYRPIEILQNYNPDADKVIYLVGEKDMKEDPRFAFTPTKTGAPSYFQPYKSLEEMVSFKEKGGHGYVVAPGTITFTVSGKQIQSASELRKMFKESDKTQRMDIVADVVGKPDQKIYDLFTKKLG